jgi:hypothetical protein
VFEVLKGGTLGTLHSKKAPFPDKQPMFCLTCHLVGGWALPLWKMMDFVSWQPVIFHQPEMFHHFAMLPRSSPSFFLFSRPVTSWSK